MNSKDIEHEKVLQQKKDEYEKILDAKDEEIQGLFDLLQGLQNDFEAATELP